MQDLKEKNTKKARLLGRECLLDIRIGTGDSHALVVKSGMLQKVSYIFIEGARELTDCIVENVLTILLIQDFC